MLHENKNKNIKELNRTGIVMREESECNIRGRLLIPIYGLEMEPAT
jgi:hypothetical protein